MTPPAYGSDPQGFQDAADLAAFLGLVRNEIERLESENVRGRREIEKASEKGGKIRQLALAI